MKVRKPNELPVAERIFTDREEPRAAFWKNYDICKQDIAQDEGDIHVLSYYGIGGIGKSRLLKKLTDEMDEKISKPKYVYFDFNIHQESRAVLEALKNKLSKSYGFSFPLFELGVYYYAKKIGENADAPESKAYSDKPFLNLLFSALSSDPVLGPFLHSLTLLDNGFAYIRTYRKNHRRELPRIKYKDVAELYRYLPYLFAQDMTNNLRKSKEPLVILLDTYERLVNEMSTVGEQLNSDLWLRGEEGLIQNIPGVLWVIAGRETLKWEQFDPEWSTSLEQHILGSLGPADSESFLKSAGIADEPLRKQLYTLTGGTPVYLDLCVDLFHNAREKGIRPDIEYFGDNMYSLIERFARDMDDTRKNIVYLLACMQQWDDNLIREIAGSVLPGFNFSAYERVKSFSFIIDSGNGNYNIHQTVGSVLLQNCPDDLKRDTAFRTFAYYQECLEKKTILDDDYAYHLQHLSKLGLLIHEKEEDLYNFYTDQISDRLLMLGKAGKFISAEMIQKPFCDKAEQYHNSLYHARILLDRTELKICAGQYQESLAIAKEAYELYHTLLGEDHVDTLKAMDALSLALRESYQLKEALELQKRAYEMHKLRQGNHHSDTLKSLKGLAVTTTLLGQHKKALELHTKVLEETLKLHGEDHADTLTAKDNLAAAQVYLGEYEKALALQKQVLEKSRKLHGEDHPGTLTIMSNMAATLEKLDQKQEALSLFQTVFDKRRNLLGENHPLTVTAMSNLAAVFFDLDQYEKALELQTQVLEKSKKIYEENQYDVIIAMTSLATTLDHLKRYNESSALYREILAKRQSTSGEDHPETIRIMTKLAAALLETEHFEESVALFRTILAKRQKLKGEDHTDTITAIKNLALSLERSKQYTEAVTLRRSVVTKLRKKLGENDPETLSATQRLALTLEASGQTKEATKHYETVLEKYHAIYGENDPRTIEALELLSRVCVSIPGRFKESTRLRAQAMEKRVKNRGEDIDLSSNAVKSVFSIISYFKVEKINDSKHTLNLLISVLETYQSTRGKKKTKVPTKLLIFLFRILGDRGVVTGLQEYLEKLEQN